MSDNPIIHADTGTGLDKTEYEKVDAHTITGIKLADASTELTMTAAGVITVTQSWHTVDTFGNAASQPFTRALGLQAGWIYLIEAEHTDRTVVITHGTYIRCFSGLDFSLSNTNRGFWCFSPDGSILREIVRAQNI